MKVYWFDCTFIDFDRLGATSILTKSEIIIVDPIIPLLLDIGDYKYDEKNGEKEKG